LSRKNVIVVVEEGDRMGEIDVFIVVVVAAAVAAAAGGAIG
jgi:hypothetical protein